MSQLDFSGVKGYKTYANAVKRGEEVAEQLKNMGDSSRWVVISLPNGRFAPSFIYNDRTSKFNPGSLIHMVNVCVMN